MPTQSSMLFRGGFSFCSLAFDIYRAPCYTKSKRRFSHETYIDFTALAFDVGRTLAGLSGA